MLSIRLLWHCFWFLQIAVNGALSFVLIQRRWYREFPFFVTYITWRAVEGVVLLGMNYAPFVSGTEYAVAFALGRAFDAALALAIVSEIFKHVISSQRALRNFGTALFRWVTIVLLVGVVALAWLAPAAGEGRLMAGFYILDRTVNSVLCGLLLLLFIFPRMIGVSWRSQVFGIALGLGILATLSLAMSAVRSQIEPIARNHVSDIMDLLTHGTYLSSILVWTAYSLMPERHSPRALKALPDHDLETWNQELRRLLHQ